MRRPITWRSLAGAGIDRTSATPHGVVNEQNARQSRANEHEWDDYFFLTWPSTTTLLARRRAASSAHHVATASRPSETTSGGIATRSSSITMNSMGQPFGLRSRI